MEVSSRGVYALSNECIKQGDYSPDNVKFPDNSLTIHDSPARVKCYSYHACIAKYQYGLNANIQLTINSFRPLFPDKIFSPYTSMSFSKIRDLH